MSVLQGYNVKINLIFWNSKRQLKCKHSLDMIPRSRIIKAQINL